MYVAAVVAAMADVGGGRGCCAAVVDCAHGEGGMEAELAPQPHRTTRVSPLLRPSEESGAAAASAGICKV